MAKPGELKIKLNYKNIGTHVLKGSGTDAALLSVAKEKAEAATSIAGGDAEFEAVMGESGTTRHRAFVRPANYEATRAQATDHVLERALGS